MLCDLDGTLYRPGPMKLLMAAELLLLGAHRLALLRAFRHEHERLREELAKNEQLRFEPTPFDEQIMRTAQLRALEPALLRGVVLEWMVQRPGKWLGFFRRKQLLDELAAFKASGGKLAVVSDYPARAKLESMRVRPLFDAVVASGEHPRLTRLKPAPDGYLLAAEEVGVPPEACLVLGDRADADGLAAQRARMGFRLIR